MTLPNLQGHAATLRYADESTAAICPECDMHIHYTRFKDGRPTTDRWCLCRHAGSGSAGTAHIGSNQPFRRGERSRLRPAATASRHSADHAPLGPSRLSQRRAAQLTVQALRHAPPHALASPSRARKTASPATPSCSMTCLTRRSPTAQRPGSG